MADQNTRVNFEAKDNGISSFMKKLMDDAKKMYSSFADEAKKQTISAKEQNKFIQERIALLKEELRIKKDLAREELRNARKAYETTLNRSPENTELLNKQLGRQREAQARFDDLSGQQASARFAGRNRESGEGGGGGQNIFSSVLAAGILRDLIGLARGLPHAQTGLDFVSPVAQIAGGAIGGLAGIPIAASAYTMQLGKDVSGIAADLVVRHMRTLDQYNRARLGYTAIGGDERSMGMGRAGFDQPAVMEAMVRSSGAAGTGRGARTNSALMLSLSRLGFASEGDSLGALGMQRMGGGSGAVNMQKTLALAFSEGLDKARFADVIRTQTQLMQHFAQTSTNVNPTDASRSIFEFNRMGGMFTAGDPRSVSSMMAISQGLANPGSPFAQAQNYSILRRLNPSADPWELKKMESKGLQTPGFLRGAMDQISGSGFSEPLQKMMLRGRFGDLPMEAIDTLFANKGKLGSMSEKDLGKMIGLDTIQKMAEDHTSRLTAEQAKTTDAFLVSWKAGTTELAIQFKTEFKSAILEAAEFFKEQFTPQQEKEYQAKVVASRTPPKSGLAGIAQWAPVTP